MSDFELVTSVDAENPIIGDLRLIDGQLSIIGGDIRDRDDYSRMVAQRLRARWLMVRGEWYLDQKLGTPWREYIWGKAGIRVGDAKIATILRLVALGTPGVESVESLEVTLDRRARTLDVAATVITDLQTQVTIGQIDRPFIVRV